MDADREPSSGTRWHIASDSEPAKFETVRSSLARDTMPIVSPEELERFSLDEANFAIDLYRGVRTQPASAGANVFLSPYSVSTALAMTYAGARGKTHEEMKTSLHFGLEEARLHKAFNYLDLALSSREATEGDARFRLHVANSLWGPKGSKVEQPFLDTLGVDYGAGLNLLDFGNSREAAATINGWVEKQTESRIKDLVNESMISDATRMVLVNAIYFNAAWPEGTFDASATAPAPFTKLDDAVVQAATMHTHRDLPYAKGDGFEAIEMPYDDPSLALLALVPDPGTFVTYEATLTGEKVLDVLAGLESRTVELAFPKLEVEGEFFLDQPLKELGITSFERGADLTGMFRGFDDAKVTVVHKTFLSLDEKGTEAAAATAVAANDSAAPTPKPPVVLNVDRPFVFAIVDRPTRTLLFIGRILEPKP